MGKRRGRVVRVRHIIFNRNFLMIAVSVNGRSPPMIKLFLFRFIKKRLLIFNITSNRTRETEVGFFVIWVRNLNSSNFSRTLNVKFVGGQRTFYPTVTHQILVFLSIGPRGANTRNVGDTGPRIFNSIFVSLKFRLDLFMVKRHQRKFSVLDLNVLLNGRRLGPLLRFLHNFIDRNSNRGTL